MTPSPPLLFGLFVDRVEKWLAERLPQVGVQLGAHLVQLLLYADNLTRLASSPPDLQALLDVLQGFSACLEVNLA